MENNAITRPSMSGRLDVCRIVVVTVVKPVAITPTGRATTTHHQYVGATAHADKRHAEDDRPDGLGSHHWLGEPADDHACERNADAAVVPRRRRRLSTRSATLPANEPRRSSRSSRARTRRTARGTDRGRDRRRGRLVEEARG